MSSAAVVKEKKLSKLCLLLYKTLYNTATLQLVAVLQ